MDNLYKKIYRLWEQTTDIEIVGYDADDNPIKIERVSGDYIWDFGVKVCATEKMKGRKYTLSEIAVWYGVGNAPMTYAEIFAGDYDIIQLFADRIMEDYGIEE